MVGMAGGRKDRILPIVRTRALRPRSVLPLAEANMNTAHALPASDVQGVHVSDSQTAPYEESSRWLPLGT
jgi:hypothetical protein